MRDHHAIEAERTKKHSAFGLTAEGCGARGVHRSKCKARLQHPLLWLSHLNSERL